MMEDRRPEKADKEESGTGANKQPEERLLPQLPLGIPGQPKMACDSICCMMHYNAEVQLQAFRADLVKYAMSQSYFSTLEDKQDQNGLFSTLERVKNAVWAVFPSRETIEHVEGMSTREALRHIIPSMLPK